MGVLQTKGQEDSVMFKVAYKATFKGKQESKLKEDFQVLEVGREYSEYYSIYDREFQHKSDSLKNAGDSATSNWHHSYMARMARIRAKPIKCLRTILQRAN